MFCTCKTRYSVFFEDVYAFCLLVFCLTINSLLKFIPSKLPSVKREKCLTTRNRKTFNQLNFQKSHRLPHCFTEFCCHNRMNCSLFDRKNLIKRFRHLQFYPESGTSSVQWKFAKLIIKSQNIFAMHDGIYLLTYIQIFAYLNVINPVAMHDGTSLMTTITHKRVTFIDLF